MTERRRTLGMAGTALVLLALPIVDRPAPRWVWNSSASSPIGLYRIAPGERPGPGDRALIRTPLQVRWLAARRGYIPATVPLVKRVSAGAGQRVCAAGAIVTVDGAFVARRRPRDPSGRELPRWRGCHVLAPDEIFVLGDGAQSFDGRYFGPIGGGDVIGKAVPSWLR